MTTKEQIDHHVQYCWKQFDMDKLHAAYRSAVHVMYAIGEQIAERDRRILRGELGEWDEYLPIEHEDIARFTEQTPFPRCMITNHIVDGERITQLSYNGLLPLYFFKNGASKDKQMEIESYRKIVKDYYIRATLDALKLLPTAETPEKKNKAFIYLCYFFKDLKIRDLDNRNRSVLINAARYGLLIDGDEWEKLAIMEEGFLNVNKRNHVSMFISNRNSALKVVEYVNSLYQNGYSFWV